MKKTKKFFRDRPARWQRSPDALHSRMRLAKGFFLPVFVAQIGDFKLPCTIGRASAGGSPEAFFEEITIFQASFSILRLLKKFL